MVHELTKTEHDGLTVGDRVYLASDGKQRAGLRYGTLVNISRATPRGHFWYRVEWDGEQHHKARAVLTRQEIVKLVDTRAPKPSRPTVAELQAEVAELRGQLAESEAIADQRQQTRDPENWERLWLWPCDQSTPEPQPEPEPELFKPRPSPVSGPVDPTKEDKKP